MLITTLIEKTGKPVVNDKVDRFGPEAQLLSLLQCIGEDGRTVVVVYSWKQTLAKNSD